MKTLFLICVAGLISVTSAQEPPEAKPAAEHLFLQKEAGRWAGTMKVWMGGPDQPPQELPMAETVEVIPGGFWTRSVFESGPFRGYSQMGYDPVRQEFVGTWIDSSTPFISVMKGALDESKKKLVMTYDGYDQQTMKPARFRNITVYVSDDVREFTTEQLADDGKTWIRSFVINYKRIK